MYTIFFSGCEEKSLGYNIPVMYEVLEATEIYKIVKDHVNGVFRGLEGKDKEKTKLYLDIYNTCYSFKKGVCNEVEEIETKVSKCFLLCILREMTIIDVSGIQEQKI